MLNMSFSAGSSSSCAMLATAAIWGISAVVAYAVFARFRDWRRLKHIDGPSLAGWTDYWMIRSQLSGRMNLDLADVVREYGPVARIGTNTIVCADVKELRKIWAVRSTWKRPRWYLGLRIDPYSDNVFSLTDDKVHETLRSKLMPGYGGKDVDGVHEIIDEQISLFVRLLEDKYLSVDGKDSKGKSFLPVDLARKVQFLTLDIISSLAFGESFGNLVADDDALGYISTTEKSMPMLMFVTLVPWLTAVWQSPRLRWAFPDARKMVGIGDVMAIARRVVGERYGEKPEVVKRDMLGSFVAHGLTKGEAESETMVQIVAGSDTSATAIRSTLLFIITNPAVYSRLQAEIDAAAAEGRISSPITDAEARALPYLQAVIREGLRMYPPATGLLPKVSSKDEILCGKHIPAGTDVGWAVWPVMRDRGVFGDDADLFRPERWVEAAPEQWRVMDQTVMMDFATGSRWECLGKTIAMIELNKAYVELLRRFDITLLDPSNPWHSFNAAFFIQKNMNVKISRRKTPV
ncbi:hypothetical protein ACKVWC_006309 [Pyricularia oryzae]